MLALLSWIPLLLYLCAALPQLVTNYRRGSSTGVSHDMLFLRVSSGMFYVPYLFLCQLPWAYRVVLPIYVTLLAFLAYQSWAYEKNKNVQVRIRYQYFVAMLVSLSGLIVAMWHPVEIGMLYGWTGITLSFFCEWPQLYLNWYRKSVAGLNFGFLSCIGIGGIIELLLAYHFCLPRPTLYNALRVSSYYLLYGIQFLLYR